MSPATFYAPSKGARMQLLSFPTSVHPFQDYYLISKGMFMFIL